jgi:hypothetical protein
MQSFFGFAWFVSRLQQEVRGGRQGIGPAPPAGYCIVLVRAVLVMWFVSVNMNGWRPRPTIRIWMESSRASTLARIAAAQSGRRVYYGTTAGSRPNTSVVAHAVTRLKTSAAGSKRSLTSYGTLCS